MQTILILGAGKSATDLIRYVLERSEQYDWQVIVGDLDKALAAKKIAGHQRGTAVYFDVNDADLRAQYVQQSDIVASLLPASLHHLVAEDCLRFGKNIVTPSYISAKHKAMDADFRAAGLLFMGEIGLDPGIDHMTLMQTLEELQAKGAAIKEIRSCCGALIAPEADNNPWHYKFTWAPMNVVKAGQGTAQYLKNGRSKYIPYNRLFELYETHFVEGYGNFEAYANRDSMAYIDKYKLKNVPTFVRCTLRREGYCDAWNALVKLGWTDDSYRIAHSETMTYNDFVEAFLPKAAAEDKRSLQERLADFLAIEVDGKIMQKLAWLGIFDHRPVEVANATPAQILLHLLTDKWKLGDNDSDMVVMLHQFDYELDGKKECLKSTLVMKGEDAEHTVLAKTVGIPMGIMVKLILTGQVQGLTGVHMPIMKEVYKPIIEELKSFGVEFVDTVEVV